MSSLNVNDENTAKKMAGWDELIVYSESAIEAYTQKIRALRKSLVFFKKQAKSGARFPVPESTRHTKIS